VIDRKQEVPHEGPMCDLLWSDPDGESASDSPSRKARCGQSSPRLVQEMPWGAEANDQIYKDGGCHLEELDSCSEQM